MKAFVRQGKTEFFIHQSIVGNDLLEALLAIPHQIHLVDGNDKIANPQETHQKRMAACLGQHALSGIDQDDRQVGGAGAGHHVAGILLMAGGVGDDIFALLGGEEPVSHIDGDPLFPFALQTVNQESEIELLFRCRAIAP